MHQHSGLVEWINVHTGCTPTSTHSIGNRIYLGSVYTPPIPRAICLFYYSISYLTVIRVQQLQVNLGDADCHVKRRERPKDPSLPDVCFAISAPGSDWAVRRNVGW